MTNNLLLSISRTAPANATISGAVAATGLIKITTSAVHGLSTGDIVYISGVTGTVEANGKWVVTVVDTTHFTLNNSTFLNAYSSAGTVTFLGFTSAVFLADNTIFATKPAWLYSVTVQVLTAAATCRVSLQDTADVNFVTAMAGPTFSFQGALSVSADSTRSAKAEDFPDLRIGASGNNLRVSVEDLLAGNTIQLMASFAY